MTLCRLLAISIIACISSPLIAGTYYGARATEWAVYDDIPSGAAVQSINDFDRGTDVIQTIGSGTKNSYLAGGLSTATGWNHQDSFIFNWSMNTTQNYLFLVRVQTALGPRFIYYSQLNYDNLLNANGTSIHHGLGVSSKDGNWHEWTRDLSADLKQAEPSNSLISINGVMVRGNVLLDQIFVGEQNQPQQTVYSDAEDGTFDGWLIADNTPNGAQIDNEVDSTSPSNRYIELTSAGLQNAFILGSNNPTYSWNNTTQKQISWRSKSTQNFRVYVRITTPLGWRYLWYDARNNDILANSTGTSIHHGLGTSASDGQWHTHTRDLKADLNDAEPDNTITAVHAIVVRGSLLIDDVMLSGPGFNPPPPEMPTLNEYNLVFNDEFNGTSLDSNKWNTGLLWGPYLPINNEQQLYVDTLGINQDFAHSPFTFSGDSLIINATPVSNTLQPPLRPAENDPIWDNYAEYRFNGPNDNGPGYSPENVDYLSGIITSYDTFKMTHGYVEARVKMPPGQGLWPAFWLLNTHYVEDSPEIDVVEFLGHDTNKVYHTYHYFDPSNDWQKISTPSYETTGTDWTADFHTYGLVWSPKELIWYVDGVETRRVTDADYIISTQAMYLIANLAVGGSWPGDADATTPFPAKYEIDYIRAYKKDLNPQLDLAADYQLMFSDEFSGSTLDPTKWNTSFLWGPYLTINNEEQYYVDTTDTDSASSYSPFSMSDGKLTITAELSENSPSDIPPPALPGPNDPLWQAHPEFQQGPYPSAPKYTSGLITSYDAFKFVNGYAEIRAKIPAGDGLWPAFWLLNAYYVGPLPEIDIMEILGEDPALAYHTFHRSDSNGTPIQSQYMSNSPNQTVGYADGYHTYGVRWTPGEITWYVDGQIVDTYTESDPNTNNAYQLMYVIANLAVGGNFNTQPVDETALPAEYSIDYIRVYQEK